MNYEFDIVYLKGIISKCTDLKQLEMLDKKLKLLIEQDNLAKSYVPPKYEDDGFSWSLIGHGGNE